METLGKFKWLLVGLVLIVSLILLAQKACSLYDQNSILKGRIQVQEQQLAQAALDSKNAKEILDKVVTEKDADIAKWKEVADKNKNGIVAGNQTIKNLKEQLAKIDPAEKDAIILKQGELIATLENNLTLSYQTIEAQEKIIGDWELKYAGCVVYYQTLEKERDAAYALMASKDALIKGLEGKLRTTRLFGNVTKVTTLAAIVALVVMAVAK
jgi:hypothetical protein